MNAYSKAGDTTANDQNTLPRNIRVCLGRLAFLKDKLVAEASQEEVGR